MVLTLLLSIGLNNTYNFTLYEREIKRENFEFYIAFASKLGGATGLNRIVKGC